MRAPPRTAPTAGPLSITLRNEAYFAATPPGHGSHIKSTAKNALDLWPDLLEPGATTSN